MDNVAQRIKELRIENGWTQAELAEDIITRSYLSQIERGTLDPSYQVLEQIARKMGYRMEDLLEQAPRNKNLTTVQIKRAIKLAEKNTQEAKFHKATKIIESFSQNSIKDNITNEEKGILSWIHGEISRQEGNLTDAVNYYKKSINFLEGVNNEKLVRSLTNLGYAYSLMYRYKEALQTLRKAYQIVIYEPVDGYVQVGLLMSLGIVHGKMHELHSAINFLQEANNLNRSLAIFYRSGELNMALGICYMKVDEIESAKQCYLDAVDFFKMVGNTRNLAGTFNNLGILYRLSGDTRKAISQFEKSFDLYATLGNTNEKCNVELELARAHLENNEYENVENSCYRTIDLATDRLVIIEAYELLGDMAKRNQNYPLAFDHYHQAEKYISEAHTDIQMRIKKKIGAIYHLFGEYEKASSIFFHFTADDKSKMPGF